MKAKLEALRAKTALSATDKAFIVESYKEAFGKEPNIKTKCRNCYNDAIIELLVSMRTDKIMLKRGAVIEYKGTLYNYHNMTDEIAEKVISEYPHYKKYFNGTVL